MWQWNRTHNCSPQQTDKEARSQSMHGIPPVQCSKPGKQIYHHTSWRSKEHPAHPAPRTKDLNPIHTCLLLYQASHLIFPSLSFVSQLVITIELIPQEVWEDHARQSVKGIEKSQTGSECYMRVKRHFLSMAESYFFPLYFPFFSLFKQGWLIAIVSEGTWDRRSLWLPNISLPSFCFQSSQVRKGEPSKDS